MLELRDVYSHYGPVAAVRGVSLTVREGESVCVIGSNGAGKSTLLMTICGVRPVTAGEIRFCGESIAGLPPHTIVRRGMSQVPEGRRIFPNLSVLENLEMGGYSRDPRETAEALERAFALFPVLRELRRQLGGSLSGGQQQMLAVARALMARPRLLLMDEPSLGLAPKIVETIYQVIHSITSQGTAVLLVEQNAALALASVQRGYVMDVGQVIAEGTAQGLQRDPRVRQAYLGV